MAPQKRSRTNTPKRKRTKPPIVSNLFSYSNPLGKEDNQDLFGNSFWKVKCSEVQEAKKNGRPPKFDTPEQLWNACVEYFDWVTKHPFAEQNAAAFQGDITKYHLTKPRPMTIGCLCLFLDMTYETWMGYRANKGDGFLRVCQAAEQTIREQKFMGAAAGFFNHAIIARDLGLVDKKDLTSDGEKLPAGGSVVVYLPAKEALEG